MEHKHNPEDVECLCQIGQMFHFLNHVKIHGQSKPVDVKSVPDATIASMTTDMYYKSITCIIGGIDCGEYTPGPCSGNLIRFIPRGELSIIVILFCDC